MAPSPRQIAPEQARDIISQLPPFVTTVAVLTPEPSDSALAKLRASGCQVAQLHGDWLPDAAEQFAQWLVIRALRVRTAKDIEEIRRWPMACAVLLDAYHPGKLGGTGQTLDWVLARQAKEFGKPIILAGGLTPGNVAEAIAQAQPDAVDVSNGVESSPGVKNRNRIHEFVRSATRAGAALPDSPSMSAVL